MKRIFYFAAMALAACAVMVSCEKEQDNKPNTDIDQPGEVTKLATPKVSVEIDGDNIVVSWEAVENAGSYSYVFNAESAQTTTETTVTRPTSDFEYGIENTVLVTAMPAEGDDAHTASNAGVANFTVTAPEPEPLEPGEYMTAENMSELLGTWTVTTTGTFSWPEDPENPGYVMPQYTAVPRTFEVTIEDYGTDTLMMTGWSVLGADLPTLIVSDPNPSGEEVLPIGPVTMIQVGDPSQGYAPCWYTVGADGSGFPMQPLLPYAFTKKEDGTIVGKALTYTLSYTDGTQVDLTVASYEIYAIAVDGSGNYNIYTELCDGAAGGDFTMVKKGSASAAPAYAPNVVTIMNPVIMPTMSGNVNCVLR